MGIMYKLMKHRHFSMDSSNLKPDRNRFITIEGNIIEAPASQTIKTEEDTMSSDMNSNADKQFTAEHIIQLCKFLAEKSRKNKNLHKQQQSPKKLYKSRQTQFHFQQMECDDVDKANEEIEKEVDFYQNEALPLLKIKQQQQQIQKQRTHNDYKDNEFEQEKQQKTTGILSSRLSPDINSLNISSNILTNSCALQHYHQQQQQQQQQHQQLNQHQQQHEEQFQINGKRDILLKIRRQIFERKRLRETGTFEDPHILNNSQVWRPW